VLVGMGVSRVQPSCRCSYSAGECEKLENTATATIAPPLALKISRGGSGDSNARSWIGICDTNALSAQTREEGCAPR
jgi:hypothetical protein